MSNIFNKAAEFNKNLPEESKELLKKLATGQDPEACFITCCDSRVVPSFLTSSGPGDLFVIRNAGNLVPDHASTDRSVSAALEVAIHIFKLPQIIVCGHSGCAAMGALKEDPEKISVLLKEWFRNAIKTLCQKDMPLEFATELSDINKLSQHNVILQLKNLETYPFIADKIKDGTIQIHGWWFDIENAKIYHYQEDKNQFVLID